MERATKAQESEARFSPKLIQLDGKAEGKRAKGSKALQLPPIIRLRRRSKLFFLAASPFANKTVT